MRNLNSPSLLQGLIYPIFAILICSIYLAECKSGLKYPERQRFESLLAAGRTLAYPFSAGFILTLVSNDKNNWNVSQNGIQEALGLSPEGLLESYSSLVQELKEDDNVTVSSIIYTMHEGWNHSQADQLERLITTVKRVVWDNKTLNKTWDEMNNHVSDSTNGIMDGKLIPKDTSLGTPFPFSTESAILSTFHYRNDWKNPWTDGGLRNFYDSGIVKFMQIEGQFLISSEEEYTSISIPLEGEMKFMVLVFPNANITKYFRGRGEADEEGDVVPFPKSWKKKFISILIPSFNLTSTDQYGKELEELGMNQTFCTTLHDRRGRFPFYMRPIVQVNSIELNEESLEIASATGTAIEKFYLGLDVGGKGYPKSKSQIDSKSAELATTLNVTTSTPDTFETISKTQPEEIVFNRPFLFYLNDTTAGPMFYGIVEKIQAVDETDNKEKDSITAGKAEAEKFILWSCKSFKLSEDENEKN